jgi:hypothetical protein
MKAWPRQRNTSLQAEKNEWIIYYHVNGAQSICGFASFIIRRRAIFRDMVSRKKTQISVRCMWETTRQQLLHSCKAKSGEATRARTPLRQMADEWLRVLAACQRLPQLYYLCGAFHKQLELTLRYVEPCWPTFVHVFARSMTAHWLSLQKNHRSKGTTSWHVTLEQNVIGSFRWCIVMPIFYNQQMELGQLPNQMIWLDPQKQIFFICVWQAMYSIQCMNCYMKSC